MPKKIEWRGYLGRLEFIKYPMNCVSGTDGLIIPSSVGLSTLFSQTDIQRIANLVESGKTTLRY